MFGKATLAANAAAPAAVSRTNWRRVRRGSAIGQDPFRKTLVNRQTFHGHHSAPQRLSCREAARFIHQLIATHCTYGTSALERRKGEDADRVLGYSVRASPLEGGALAGWYRKIERLLYYYLPRDAAAEAKRQLTAASAPKRLIYVPAIDDLEVLVQVCYRPTDTAGRTGS